MQEDGRLGAGRAGALPIDQVAVADIEMAGGIGFDFGIERAQHFSHIFKPFAGQVSVSWSGCWKEMICSCRA